MKTYYLFTTLIFLVISINCNSQPVAVDDYISPIIQSFEIDTFNIIQNDYDTNGNLFRIYEIYQKNGSVDELIPFHDYNDTSIVILGYINYERVFKYRLCYVSDTTMISNWAYVTVNVARDPDLPVAHNDTVSMSPGDSIYVNILANDYDPNGDSIFIDSTIYPFSNAPLFGTSELIGDSIKIKLAFNDYAVLNNGNFSLRYRISDTSAIGSNNSDQGLIHVKINNGKYFDFIDINNIKARFSCFGNNFWDLRGSPQYFYPNGAQTTASFGNGLWIGGKSHGTDTILHLAAERFRQNGADYWAGPISDIYDSDYDKRWFHVWKLNRDGIEYHKQNWWQTGYQANEEILTWPGNGNTTLGQTEQIAPFSDLDNDGIYEPSDGEYPYIRGDQALFFVFNDMRHDHFESQSPKLGIEIHAMVYAFDTPQDSALWNTIFVHYDILNKSDTTYYETYIGNWTDADVGYAWDDYVGCNVEGGYFYFYNGEAVDGSGQINAYGTNPPVSATKILAGPRMEADNIDNPSGGCDESINGINFGDSIIDNERLGMTSFRYFSSSNTPWGDPNIGIDYYNYMAGKWLDGTTCVYGGIGHQSDPNATNYPTQFMFPGTSDPCGWGQGGVILPEWSEETEENPTGDRRGVGISGPFILEAGETESIDYAYINAFGNGQDPNSAIDTIDSYCNYITQLFENNDPIFIGMESQSTFNTIKVYPNPTSDKVNITLNTTTKDQGYHLMDITGKIVLKGNLSGGITNQISVSGLTGGIYFIRIFDTISSKSFKIIKL